MSKIKIAFFDIDGTLIDMEKKQITPVTLEVLRRLQTNGIRICLATGRSPMVVPHFEGVAFDATLTYNGSYCYTQTGETIFSNPIPALDLALIIRNAAAIARPLCLATSSRLACNGCDKDLADYFAIAKSVANIAPDFDEVAKGTVYQIMMGGRADEYASILKDVQGAKIAAWWDRAVDIIPATGGKGIGIHKMLEYYGLDKSEAPLSRRVTVPYLSIAIYPSSRSSFMAWLTLGLETPSMVAISIDRTALPCFDSIKIASR